MDLQDYFIQENLGYQKIIPFEIKTVTYKKGAKILEKGQIENNIYFLISGKIGSYIKLGETERIIEFLFPGELFCSLTSMIKQKPTVVDIICLSKCVVQVIPYEGLKEACKSSIFANTFFNHFVVKQYMDRVKKELDSLTKDPEQRYIELMKERPQVIQQIPMASIALYLGVHPNSLGRIRKRIIDNEKMNNKT